VCELTPAITTTLRIDGGALSQSVSLLWTYGCPQHNEPVLNEAELMVRELVTNAVDRGTPPLRFRVECAHPRGLTVLVGEGRTESAADAASAAVGSEWGVQGIALVDLLSDAWGLHESPDTSEVWFRLASPSLPRDK
jgi:hypothetical protein